MRRFPDIAVRVASSRRDDFEEVSEVLGSRVSVFVLAAAMGKKESLRKPLPVGKRSKDKWTSLAYFPPHLIAVMIALFSDESKDMSMGAISKVAEEYAGGGIAYLRALVSDGDISRLSTLLSVYIGGDT